MKRKRNHRIKLRTQLCRAAIIWGKLPVRTWAPSHSEVSTAWSAPASLLHFVAEGDIANPMAWYQALSCRAGETKRGCHKTSLLSRLSYVIILHKLFRTLPRSKEVSKKSISQLPTWRELTGKEIIRKHQNPETWRSWWQIVNTLVPYSILFYLMIRSLEVSYWLVLALSVPAGGLLVRIFIIFHDCGHGSFFRSQRTNTVLGYIMGILIFTPYHHWRHKHAVHHATSGDLNRRDTGDVWTMTVQEYLEASRWNKLVYRLFRNPFALFIFIPLFLFVVTQRFAGRTAGKRERQSVYLTNLALLGIMLLAIVTIGFKTYLLVQIPALFISTVVGVWMFYVQHQFEGVYWERHENWDYVAAALDGSSFYKLPKVFQWLTGNIGFHHVHHLSPRIPNYFLERWP